MKIRAIALILAVMIPFAAFAADETVEPSTLMNGFMNVFELDGGYAFGQPWGFNDLRANFVGDNLVLEAAPINDPDPFWYIGGGAPGADGNKIMEASAYAEVSGPYAGTTVNFSGVVLENTFSVHTVKAFIFDFAPDFSSRVETFVDLTGPGPFSVSLETINDPGRHVQWGFITTGVNVWPTDVEQFGAMTIAPDPEIVATDVTTFDNVKALYR